MKYLAVNLAEDEKKKKNTQIKINKNYAMSIFLHSRLFIYFLFFKKKKKNIPPCLVCRIVNVHTTLTRCTDC